MKKQGSFVLYCISDGLVLGPRQGKIISLDSAKVVVFPLH